MGNTGIRQRVMAGEVLTGTFVKTPAHEVIELLAMSGLDFLCLDAEHAPFDRGRMDACLAMGRALGISMLVRVQSSRKELILSALDSGADGIVVPHVFSAEKAAVVARDSRYGPGGRGYAGSPRSAGFGTQTMPDVLARSAEDTLVIVQIEETEAVDAADAIAATPGIDALFVGPADLSVAYGHATIDNPQVAAAYAHVGDVCRKHGKGYASWIAAAEKAPKLRNDGVNMFFVASEQIWILKGARDTASAMQDL